MALEIIGPGFGRTGTASLKIALETLGFGPCHHMHEVFANPAQVAHWQALAAGLAVDWDAAFAGYRSQVDWPGAHAWRVLADHYPQAKVILSVRPEESWWRSFSSTIGTLLTQLDTLPEMPWHIRTMLDVGRDLVERRTFGAPASDKAAALAAYRRHTAEVCAAIQPDRLLVYDMAEGWGPLCRFLGVAVPDAPFPRTNSSEEFWAALRGGAPR